MLINKDFIKGNLTVLSTDLWRNMMVLISKNFIIGNLTKNEAAVTNTH